MSYYDELRPFYEFAARKGLSTGQVALWHALMYINNECYWTETFEVANRRLEELTGLSRQGINKARNALKQYGLIDFKSNGKSKATTYRIISAKNRANSVQQSVQSSIQSNGSMSNSLQCGIQSSVQSSVQCGVQSSSTLIDKDKTRQDKDMAAAAIAPARETANLFEKYENVTGNTATQSMASDIDSFIGEGVEPDLIDAVIDYAVDGGKGNWNYMKAALNGLQSDGIITLKAYKQAQAKRTQNKAKMQQSKNKFNNLPAENTDYADLEEKLLDRMLEGDNDG